MQRCKLVMDQISEARDAMLKVLDHKEHVMKLLNKNSSTKKLSKLKRKDRAWSWSQDSVSDTVPCFTAVIPTEDLLSGKLFLSRHTQCFREQQL